MPPVSPDENDAREIVTVLPFRPYRQRPPLSPIYTLLSFGILLSDCRYCALNEPLSIRSVSTTDGLMQIKGTTPPSAEANHDPRNSI
jgi:hypothetical protein